MNHGNGGHGRCFCFYFIKHRFGSWSVEVEGSDGTVIRNFFDVLGPIHIFEANSNDNLIFSIFFFPIVLEKWRNKKARLTMIGSWRTTWSIGLSVKKQRHDFMWVQTNVGAEPLSHATTPVRCNRRKEEFMVAWLQVHASYDLDKRWYVLMLMNESQRVFLSASAGFTLLGIDV